MYIEVAYCLLVISSILCVCGLGLVEVALQQEKVKTVAHLSKRE